MPPQSKSLSYASVAHVGTQWLLPLSLLAIVLFRVTLTTSHKASRIPDSIGGIATYYMKSMFSEERLLGYITMGSIPGDCWPFQSPLFSPHNI